MIWKILKSDFRINQILGIIGVMLLGFSIILLAARFYADIRPSFRGNDLWQHEHVIISKKISKTQTTAQILGKGQKPSFSQNEIQELLKQDFINDLAVFTSSSFETSAYTDGNMLGGFYTELFFESVPSKYIDLDNDNWGWQNNSAYIPVILPKSYLNLYNFGFATSQNLPQINEEAASSVPFRIVIRGNHKKAEFQARIVGFSDRLNTILVPQEFLDYANPHFGKDSVPVSRIVLLTPDPSDPELLKFIESKQYDYNKEKMSNGKARMLLNTATAITVGTGLLINLLALWLFILSSSLLLQKNKKKIIQLKSIGYSNKEIIQPFVRLSIYVSGIVYALSLIPYFSVSQIYRNALNTIIPENSISHLSILTMGLIFIIGLSGFNLILIRKKIRKF